LLYFKAELGENFVGVEAGRLEVEKARLEVELAASRQRIQVPIVFSAGVGKVFQEIPVP
jgi:hypothetical protein